MYEASPTVAHVFSVPCLGHWGAVKVTFTVCNLEECALGKQVEATVSLASPGLETPAASAGDLRTPRFSQRRCSRIYQHREVTSNACKYCPHEDSISMQGQQPSIDNTRHCPVPQPQGKRLRRNQLALTHHPPLVPEMAATDRSSCGGSHKALAGFGSGTPAGVSLSSWPAASAVCAQARSAARAVFGRFCRDQNLRRAYPQLSERVYGRRVRECEADTANGCVIRGRHGRQRTRANRSP